jgi:hypothetical protein
MADIYGVQTPRLSCLPRDRVKSFGREVIEFASHAGLDLDPWQQYCITNMLWRRQDGKWSAFENLITVSRQNGKGSILEARELAGLYLFETDRLCIHTAHEHKTASEHFLRVRSLIQNTPDLESKVARSSSAYGREFIELKAKPTIIIASNGQYVRRSARHRLIFIARSGGSGRGFTADLLVYDEDMVLDADKVSASIPSLMARPNPQVIYTGSAGLKTSWQLASVRRRGIAGTSPALFMAEWSIFPHDEYCPPGCTAHDEADDMRSVAKANPGLGTRITAEMIERTREAFSADPEGYAREILGVGNYPAPLDGWLVIPRKWWASTLDLVDKDAEPPVLRHPVFAVDTSPDRGITTISVAGERPDGLMGVEIAERKAGTGWVIARLMDIHKRWHPARFIIDKRAAAGSFLADMEALGLPVEAVTATDVAHACGQLFDAFRDDSLRHYGQAALEKALAGADKRPLGEAWGWDRRNTAIDITPLVAATLAVWGYMRFGSADDYDVRNSVHFDLTEITRLTRAGFYDIGDLKRLAASGLISDDDIPAVMQAARGNPT